MIEPPKRVTIVPKTSINAVVAIHRKSSADALSLLVSFGGGDEGCLAEQLAFLRDSLIANLQL
jgi:hypothetical protein